MTNQIENEKKSRKKFWAVVGVGALVAATIGGGALTTLYTTIADNEFNATVTDGEVHGARLVLNGDAMEHTFDTTTFHDPVLAEWTLTNHGDTATTWDGNFDLLNGISETLAQHLRVEYGIHRDGRLTSWRDAGTMADSRTFGDVVFGSSELSIAGGESIPVAVRVSLPDPALLDGTVGDELQVLADFTVSYLDPIERS